MRAAAWHAVYNALVVPAAQAFLPIAGVLDRRVRAYVRARRGWRSAVAAAVERGPHIAAGDALWVHGASAGEFLHARPLLEALHEAAPQTPLVYTYTSPSALPLLERFTGADLVSPLPLDTLREVRAWLDLLRPAALALVDAELWPNLLHESSRRGVRLALVSARLSPRSGRGRRALEPLYRHLYRLFDVVGAADRGSAERLLAGGVPASRLRLTGDLRVDETLGLGAQRPPPELPFPAFLPLIVAGSTWPDDEAILLPALRTLRERGIFFGLVVAPHESGERGVARVEKALRASDFTPLRWSALTTRDGIAQNVDALVVDRVGVLRRLYAGARVAYVGGGFRGALHNVMEPAAARVPIVTGPRTQKSWVAAELARSCSLFEVADEEACCAVLEHLLTDAEGAGQAGARARAELERQAGAVERTVAALRESGWLRSASRSEGEPAQRAAGAEIPFR